MSLTITKTLLKTENVRLVRIPPPPLDKPAIHPRDGLYDVSSWDWEQVVWFGKLALVQEDQWDDYGKCTSTAKVELINYNNDVFGVVQCDLEGENVKQTHSKRAFRVFIDHTEDTKVALGLVFDDSSVANDFVGAMRKFITKALESIKGKEPKIKAKVTPKPKEKEVAQQDIHSAVSTMSIKDTAGDDDDDGFGDFVTG